MNELKERIEKEHGVKLTFMPFVVQAVIGTVIKLRFAYSSAFWIAEGVASAIALGRAALPTILAPLGPVPDQMMAVFWRAFYGGITSSWIVIR